MIEKPTVTELLDKAQNRYELVIMTAKRARQIANGAMPLTDVNEERNVTLAANEIAEGKVRIVRDDEEEQTEIALEEEDNEEEKEGE